MVTSKPSLSVAGGPKERPALVYNNAFWFVPAAFLSQVLGSGFQLQPIPGSPQAELESQIAEMESNIKKSGYTGGLVGLKGLPLAG